MNTAAASAAGTLDRRMSLGDGARRDWVVVVCLMAAALAIRLKGLDAANLWLDEANSWYVARAPWTAMLEDLRRSPVSPLYFTLLKGWISAFGESVFALRAMSVLASIALIPIVFAIGVRLHARRTGIIGALLLACSPGQLYLAQEARMYMLVTLLAALSVLCYVRWRDVWISDLDDDLHNVPIKWLLSYALCCVALLLTHFIGVLFLLAINADAILLVWRARARLWRPAVLCWVAAHLCIAIIVSAYVLTIDAATAASTQEWRGPLGAPGAIRAMLLFPFTAIYGSHIYPHEFHDAALDVLHGQRVSLRLLTLTLLQPMTFVVLAYVLLRDRRIRGSTSATDHRHGRQLLWLVLLVPLLIGAAVSVRRELDLPRYLSFAVVPLFLLAADMLTALSVRAQVISLGILLTAMGVGTQSERRIVSRDSDYRATAKLLAHDANPQDRLLIQPREMGVPLSYYLQASKLRPVGIAMDGSVADALREGNASRTWVVLDYRSPLYSLEPKELANALHAVIERDLYTADASAGVRVALIEHLTTR